MFDDPAEETQTGAVGLTAFGDGWTDAARAVVVLLMAAVGEEYLRPALRPPDGTGHRWDLVQQRNQLGDVESALAYMRGLIAPLKRKNGWTLAEQAGHAAPDRIHRLLNRIEWDADEVLGDVRDYVVEHLGDPGAVLVVDDTGFLKKGVRSAGVQRQYSGPGRCWV